MALNKGGAVAITPTAKPEVVAPKDLYDGSPLLQLEFLTPEIKMLLTGDTGSGKTTQCGELAEYIKITTGKNSVMFTMDKGGILPVRPYVDLGVIEVEMWDGVIPPWIWVSHALKGEAKRSGKWVKITEDKGLGIFEGLTAFSEMCLMDLSEHSAEHPSQAVGGDSAWTYEVQDGTEIMKMASNTMSHYGLVQMKIMQELFKAGPGVPSLWTALLARGNDAYGGLLGAQTVGNKQAASVPRWFDLTFRLNARPEQGGVKHTLYLETHMDPQAKGSKVLANARLPLAGAGSVVDMQVTPASLVSALLQIQKRYGSGREEIAARLKRYLGK